MPQNFRKYLDSVRNKFKSRCDSFAPKHTKIPIWIIGVGVLVGLTVKDFLPLLADYRNNNVAINVEVVVMDESFRPPQMVLGIFHYKNENQENEDLMKISHYLHNGTESMCELCQELEKV